MRAVGEGQKAVRPTGPDWCFANREAVEPGNVTAAGTHTASIPMANGGAKLRAGFTARGGVRSGAAATVRGETIEMRYSDQSIRQTRVEFDIVSGFPYENIRAFQ
jgi:hypothetical protein